MRNTLKLLLFPKTRLWTPGLIPGAILWDMSVESSYTTATGVSSWTDIYTGKTVSQATGSAQPTLTTFNGFPALNFNGSQFLAGVDAGMPTGNFTFIASSQLGIPLPRTSYSLLVNYGANSAGSGIFLMYGNDGNTPNNNCWAVSQYGNSHGIDQDYLNVPIISTARRTGTSYLLDANAQNLSTKTMQTNTSLTGAANSLAIGSWNSALSFGGKHTGLLQKLLIIPSFLSGDLFDRAVSWAAWNSGLQASLPSGHPYKNSPPAI